ncbi:MAG: homocysteine S-methyltransferase family protein [Rhodocyclaceae bacterium]
MSRYRHNLPQLADRTFLADSGLETTLIFHDGMDIPHFASFVLLETESGRARLRRYYAEHIALAREAGRGIVLETPTWRANPDWGAKLGYDAARLAAINRRAVEEIVDLRAELENPASPIVVSGNLGPRGDGYRADARMTSEQAQGYHAPQIETFAATDADMVAVFTMNYVEEAIGIARAAQAAAVPVAVSFTLETDGRLPSGMTLGEAIVATDDATGGYPAYYMINCAHPSHFAHILGEAEPWHGRIRGVRANASKRSHAELDEAVELDVGDPGELAEDYRALAARLPRLAVVGGCCGTDHRHIAAIRDGLGEWAA